MATTMLVTTTAGSFDLAVDYDTLREGIAAGAMIEAVNTNGERVIVNLATTLAVRECTSRNAIGFTAAEARYAAAATAAYEAAHDFNLEA